MLGTSPSCEIASFVRRGSPAYRKITIALFLAGVATFSLIYCVQPLLPLLADDFHVGARRKARWCSR